MTNFEKKIETIKTIAIVIGVLIAINELVIKNVSHQRTVASYTQRLIELDATGPMVQAVRDFSRIYYKDVVADGGVVSEEDAWNIDQATLPQLRVFIAWEACFEAELCDDQIGLRYICNRAVTYEKLRTNLKPFISFEEGQTNGLFFGLLKRCKKAQSAT